MIDPASVTPAEERRSQSGFPTKTRSETTVSQSNVPDLVPDTSSEDDDDDDDSVNEEQKEVLSLSPAETRVIRRIAARANVLPVIAHSDSLTDEKLKAVKRAVLTGLSQAGIDLGVFAAPGSLAPVPETQTTPKRKTKFATPNGKDNSVSESQEKPTDTDETTTEADDHTSAGGEESDEERVSRPVIKLRPKRHGRALSRSRSRRDLSQVAEDERRPVSPDFNDHESVANVRFSAHIVAKEPLTSLLPFALIAPEPGRRRLKLSSPTAQRGVSPNSPQSETASEVNVPQTPVSVKSMKNVPFLSGPPEDLKGIFIRKYRWGTIDVLDPNHCDFAAMRTAVLSTHLKVSSFFGSGPLILIRLFFCSF